MGQLTPVLTLANVIKHPTKVQVCFLIYFFLVRLIISGNSLERRFHLKQRLQDLGVEGRILFAPISKLAPRYACRKAEGLEKR